MERLKPLAEEYGFRILPVYTLINNVWSRRPDIASVRYQGHHIMTIPNRMLGWPNEKYKTLEGNEQPMYFDREHNLRNWNLIIKNTPHIQGLIEKKLKVMQLEYRDKLYEKRGKCDS